MSSQQIIWTRHSNFFSAEVDGTRYSAFQMPGLDDWGVGIIKDGKVEYLSSTLTSLQDAQRFVSELVGA